MRAYSRLAWLSLVGVATLACEGEEKPAPARPANACGGVARLTYDGAPASPGEVCGPCLDGVLVCGATNWLRCDGPNRQRNACGSCEPLLGQPGAPCEGGRVMRCGAAVPLTCEVSERNACGGVSALEHAPGEPCGAHQVWRCDDAGALVCATLVGPSGGAVRGPGVELVVPAGALTHAAAIAIVARPGGNAEALVGPLALFPLGLAFAAPAQLRFELTQSGATAVQAPRVGGAPTRLWQVEASPLVAETDTLGVVTVLSTPCRDADGDGWSTSACVAAALGPNPPRDRYDCDDADATRHPGASELCNGLDDDCDGLIDQGLAQRRFIADLDGDGLGCALADTCRFGWQRTLMGYSDAEFEACRDGTAVLPVRRDYDGGACTVLQACAVPTDLAPLGFVEAVGDCAPLDGSITPGKAELADLHDNDCDGEIDE